LGAEVSPAAVSNAARWIVDAIVEDLSGRASGWDDIDKPIQQEIREAWEVAARKILESDILK
jgi:hypothetical protein